MAAAPYSFCHVGVSFLFLKGRLLCAGLLGSGSIWGQEAEKAPDKTLMFI
jgi:hypothetical protein